MNLLFLWVMSGFQINAKFLGHDVTADAFWMGFYHQAPESLGLSHEERKMRIGVLIGRLSVVILVLCTSLKCCVQIAFLVYWSQMILRCFSASPALQWWGAASTVGPYLCSTAFGLKWWRPLLLLSHFFSDQGLTRTGGSFEIKHFFLRRTKGTCRPPGYGRALSLLSWTAVTVSSPVGLLLQIYCLMWHAASFSLCPLPPTQQLAQWSQMDVGRQGCSWGNAVQGITYIAFPEPCKMQCSVS